MHGHSVATYREPDNVIGLYRKTFSVPAEWEGRLVKINFDGVQNGAEIWLNGEPVKVDEPSWGRENYHESGWTAFQADLTPHVKFGGDNLLAIRVTKNTKSADLDSGDYFLLGGVHRTVTLFSVPQRHVEDYVFRTTLLDGGERAEVKVIAVVVGGEGGTLTMQLGDFDPASADVGEDGRVEVTQTIDDPKLWSAEKPNLHDLTLSLTDGDGGPVQELTRRVGVREVTTEGGVLLVNGVPVKLAGMCRHDVWPTTGTATNEEMWRTDIALMKAANVNAIRTSHYPYGSVFYDLCDEMGMYVVDELPYCWCPTDDPEMTPAFLQRARETTRRDKNHPSVIVWAIGNEVEPGQNVEAVARLLKELDPTRPALMTRHDATVYDQELSDRHYTTPEEMQRLSDRDNDRGAAPMIYTENPNVWEIRLGPNGGNDFGALDLWHNVLEPVWDVTTKNDDIVGLFPWEWQDRAVADEFPIKLWDHDPQSGLSFLKVKGIVDACRNPRPEYYNLKQIYPPIRVGEPKVSGGTATVEVENRYSFTNLSELATTWTLLRDGETVSTGTETPDVSPLSSGTIRLDLGGVDDADALRISFDRADGTNVTTHETRLRPRPDLAALDATPPEGLMFPRLNLVTNDTRKSRFKWREIDRPRRPDDQRAGQRRGRR